MSLDQIRSQFGPGAEDYASSQVHAKGASLARLVEFLSPRPDWQVLDIATGAGHTAHVLSPHVARVVATDITPEMLQVASRIAAERGLTNVEIVPADAANLPFASNQFDLITCRIAAHHFPELGAFIAEAVRCLRQGGLLALVDNIVPGTFDRGSVAQRLRDAGRYVNTFERLRDPSHIKCLSQDEWLEQFYQGGLRVIHLETMEQTLDFDSWAARMRVSEDDLLHLRVMVRQAPSEVIDYLKPRFVGQKITFSLTEILIVGLVELWDSPMVLD